MPLNYTSSVRLAKPSTNYPAWDVPLNANADALDALSAIGGLAVAPAETPSSSLSVRVAPGVYGRPDGTAGTLAVGVTLTLPASGTTVVYLDASGTAQQAGAFPTTACVRLATVITGTASVVAVADARVVAATTGTDARPYLPTAGGKLADGGDVATGTVTGSRLATDPTQKLGFWGAAPVVQPSGAPQAAVTAPTTGAAALAQVGPTNTADVSPSINGNFAAINTQLSAALADLAASRATVNALRAALVAAGLIKGSA